MLAYETISDALLDSAEQVGLNLWQSDETIDPHSLQRTFVVTFLPQGHASPRPHTTQASITFRWDAAMTAISTLGTESLCERYHSDNVACSHSLVGCAYETALPIEVDYTIPINQVIGDEWTTVRRLVSSLQDLHRGLIDHKNVFTVDANIQFSAGEPRVTRCVAHQVWSLGDPIHELENLEDIFEDICSEVRDVLTGLAEFFGSAKPVEADELIMPMSIDIDDDRVYLRPPTA